MAALRPADRGPAELEVRLRTEPNPPAVGGTQLLVTVTDLGWRPINGATVSVKGGPVDEVTDAISVSAEGRGSRSVLSLRHRFGKPRHVEAHDPGRATGRAVEGDRAYALRVPHEPLTRDTSVLSGAPPPRDHQRSDSAYIKLARSVVQISYRRPRSRIRRWAQLPGS